MIIDFHFAQTVADLLDNDAPIATTGPGEGSSVPNQNPQDLLMEIFGTGSAPSGPTSVGPAAPKNPVDDIMSLFGSNTAPSPSLLAPSSASAPMSLSSSILSIPSAAPAAVPPNALTAFDKHGLKVTFTPQTSRQHPGMVSVTTRFQSTTGDTITNLSFQAAVPKVETFWYHSVGRR